MKHFFDVGANVGQTFTDYLNLDPKFDGWDVWCFEPSPRHLPGLMEAAQYQASRYKVHICPFGLVGYSRMRKWYIKDDPRGDSFEEYVASDHETHNVQSNYSLHVATESITNAILSVSEPGDGIVLKLDCEGSEYEILFALLHHQLAIDRIERILVEWHTIRNSICTKDHLINEFIAIRKPLENWIL